MFRYAAVALIAVTLGVVSLANQRAEATLPGTNGRVAFTVVDGDERHIWTMDANGGDRQQWTDGSSVDRSPAWSPDGTKIVYWANPVGPGMGELRIATFGTNDDDGRPGTENAFLPRWAPEGGRIIFNENIGGSGAFDIVVMDLSNNQKTNLTGIALGDTNNEFSPVYLPEGGKIAFISETMSGDSDIYIMDDVINPQPVRVTNTPSEDKEEVDWSPDGEWLVFDYTSDDNTTRHVAKIKIDGSGYAPLTSGNFYDESPRFSPDGTKIIFERQLLAGATALPQGPSVIPRQVATIDANGGAVTSLSTGDTPLDGSPDWQSVPHAANTILWGDNNCSTAIDTVDVTLTLERSAGLNAGAPAGTCPYKLGELIGISSGPAKFGSVDCMDGLTGLDALLILKFVAGITSNLQNCPALDLIVSVTR